MKASVFTTQGGPKTRTRTSVVDTFVTRPQRMLAEYMSLKPNFRVEHRADHQRITAQRALVDQNLQLDAFEVDMNPHEILTRKWITQRFERYDATGQTPVVLVGRAGRGRFFQRQP